MSTDRIDGIRGFEAPATPVPWENNGGTNNYVAPQPKKPTFNFLDEIKNHYYGTTNKGDTAYN